jgi:hypothetical protein
MPGTFSESLNTQVMGLQAFNSSFEFLRFRINKHRSGKVNARPRLMTKTYPCAKVRSKVEVFT